MTEDQLQSKIFQHLWNTYPELRRTFWAVPNGGSRNKHEAMKLKATGLIAGVHDIHFYYKKQLYTFELKVGTNKMSPEQIQFKDAVEKQGAICYEIRDFDQFMSIFYLITQTQTQIEI